MSPGPKQMAGIPAADRATLPDTHGLLGEAIALGTLVPLQGIDRGQRSQAPDEHLRAQDEFAGGREGRDDAGVIRLPLRA